MSNDSIQSKIEAIDSVVREFAFSIETFSDALRGKINELDAAMNRLSVAWEGNLHQRFEDNMKQKQAQFRAALVRADKLKERLNEVASQMAHYLEILRSAGDDV